MGGVRVGFIGITADIVELMDLKLAMGMEFVHGEDNYRQLINRHARELRQEGANIVVVMSELGIHKDYRLAQTLRSPWRAATAAWPETPFMQPLGGGAA